MGEALETRSVSARFNQQTILREVTLQIPANQVTAIIGPPGCGKSTFIRCLNRLHETTPGATMSGEILLGGHSIYDLDPTEVRRSVAMIFQRPNPFPTMSIFDNVAAGLRLHGLRNRARLVESAEQALRRAALWNEVKDRLHLYSSVLSLGQQQRLCIARALAIDPVVVLMDEPSSALDPLSALGIEELIEDLKRQYTIVIVTHNVQQAARVADQTAFFLDGEMIEKGTTTALFTTPQDKRTADYVTGRFG
ncbi:MAG: phosphate ABC transporter ATP-binding protein PstB [Bacilli bacterium]